ncbi:MAG TPA: hypothetical protein VN132_16720, partial [Bdellovibrio sp.]|nr:hypothetical protein [Bdellovibrio sp.]
SLVAKVELQEAYPNILQYKVLFEQFASTALRAYRYIEFPKESDVELDADIWSYLIIGHLSANVKHDR